MDFLSSAAHVVTRRRASSASATSSGLVQPPAPQHTNYLPPPQSLCAQFTTSMSNSDLGQQRERGSQVLSTSAPSLSPLFANQDPRQALSDGGSPASTESLPSTTTLSLEFEGGTHVIVRPNRIVRGKVIFEVAERTLATRLRIKFRGEESATVKVEEGGGDNRGKWVHQTITTFFDTDWKLWGSEVSAYSQASWDEFEPGHYEFPFALKFPNVNYPPSIEEPSGFAIRYIWTAQVDGPGLQSGLKSREFITPYRPILISTLDKEWVYKTTLKDKKHALAEVQAKLYKQTYCPDEHFEMQLNLTTLAADAKILAVNYKFQKHHEGKMLIQQGTAFREYIRNVLQGNIDIAKTNDPTQLSKTVRFDMPTRLVSPSYISRHTRVHYGLLFTITIEVGHIFKLNHTLEFNIPITIANLPYDHLVRVPELTAARDYRESDECPIFFDPVLDEPPSIAGISTSGMPMQSPPQNEEPPNYFALSDMPQQPGRKVRKERTVVLSRPAKGAFHAQGLIEALVIPGLFDEDW